jgi:hypothetical protein
MGNFIFMFLFGFLLAAISDLKITKKPIQTLVILTAVAVALNLHTLIQ